MKPSVFFTILFLLLTIGIFIQYIYPLDVKLSPQLQPTSVTNDITPYGMEASGSRGLVFGKIYANGPDGWIFSHVNGEEYLVFYILQQDIDKGLLTVHTIYNGNREITPILQGGTIFRSPDNNVYGPGSPQRQTTLTDIQRGVDGSLILTYTENGKNKVTYTIFTRGKSLIMDIEADSSEIQYTPNYEGFTLGNGLVGHTATHTFVNYMSVAPVTTVLDSSQKPLYFYSLYYDPTQTNGQWYKTNGCDKTINTDPCYYSFIYAGRKNNQEIMPLKERIYLTVSNNAEDVMVKINNPISPYKQTLQSKTQIDIYATDTFKVFNKDAIGVQWTSPSKSTATIDITLQRTTRSGDYINCALETMEQSNGIVFTIKQNDITVLKYGVPGADLLAEKLTIPIQVNEKDKIRFLLSTLENLCEDTKLTISINLNGKTYSYPQQFSQTQGENGWEYISYIDGDYLLLSYDMRLKRWQTPEYKSYISDHSISPPNYHRFSHISNFVEELQYFGITDIIFSFANHGKDGFDIVHPARFPPNEVRGGILGINKLGSVVKNSGGLFSLYFIPNWISQAPPPDSTNYYSLYFDHVIKNNNGLPLSAKIDWVNGIVGYCPSGNDICLENIPGVPDLYCPLNGYCYKGSRFSWVDVGKMTHSIGGKDPLLELDLIPAEQTLNLDAVFLDTLAGGSPSWAIDFFEPDSEVKTISEVLSSTKSAFSKTKEIIGGPVASEASSMQGWKNILGGVNTNEQRQDILYAGYIDGMSFSPDYAYREDMVLIPNFAHKSINPLMTPHGVGFRNRVYNYTKQFNLDEEDCKPDFYRAMELTFGFANYLGGTTCTNDPYNKYHLLLSTFLKEYYLMYSIQKEYVGVPVNKILYESQGELVDLSEALKRNVNFLDDKIYIEYSNGFRIYINYDRNSNWIISNTPKGTITLPTYGFVAWKQNEVFAASYLNNGNKVDYVESNDYTMGDGRGVMTNFFNKLDSKYLTVELNNGDIIICENALGCSKNQKISSLPDLKTTIPAALLGESQSIEIKGSGIHPNAQLIYQGKQISNLYYKVLDSNTIYLFLHGQFQLGNNDLIVKNPGDITGKLNLIITDQACYDGDGDKFPIQLKSSVSCSVKLDCNDSDSSINPDAKEICGNDIDEDCNGTDLACQGSTNGGSGSGSGSGGSGNTKLGNTIFVNLDNSNASIFNFTKQDIIKLTSNKEVYTIIIDRLVSNKVDLKISPGEKIISLNPNIWQDINLDESEKDDIRFRVDEIYSTSKIKLRIENIIYLNGTRIKTNFTDELDIEDKIGGNQSTIVLWVISLALTLGIIALIVIILRLRRTRPSNNQDKTHPDTKEQY